MNTRINALVKLGKYISSEQLVMESAIQQGFRKNSWFVPVYIRQSLNAISNEFLTEKKLIEWTEKYSIEGELSKLKVGIIMAGNLPLVGFHDWLCCFICGHDTLIKMSSKDDVLLKVLVDILNEINDDILPVTEFVEQLKGYDAVIATGTNNSALHFEQYFKNSPHIIRRNRTSLAVLDGTETRGQLLAFGHDVFDYFGMGCRNVSKVFLPKNYDFTMLKDVLEEEFPLMIQNHKYRNNYDYNLAIFLINQVEHKAYSTILLLENIDIYSRMASLHYEYYDELNEVTSSIDINQHNIQCIISDIPKIGKQAKGLGTAQCPGLMDYADGTDTLAFLCEI